MDALISLLLSKGTLPATLIGLLIFAAVHGDKLIRVWTERQKVDTERRKAEDDAEHRERAQLTDEEGALRKALGEQIASLRQEVHDLRAQVIEAIEKMRLSEMRALDCERRHARLYAQFVRATGRDPDEAAST